MAIANVIARGVTVAFQFCHAVGVADEVRTYWKSAFSMSPGSSGDCRPVYNLPSFFDLLEFVGEEDRVAQTLAHLADTIGAGRRATLPIRFRDGRRPAADQHLGLRVTPQ